jgi:hypothetical protein
MKAFQKAAAIIPDPDAISDARWAGMRLLFKSLQIKILM